jgi:hypothetical protein
MNNGFSAREPPPNFEGQAAANFGKPGANVGRDIDYRASGRFRPHTGVPVVFLPMISIGCSRLIYIAPALGSRVPIVSTQ